MTSRPPVLAVLPVRASGDDEGIALLEQGLLEDLCGELARFPTLQVISWMSGLAVAGLPDGEVGRRLGATHVLRGRLDRQSGRMRLTANLIECARNTQLWNERFETPAKEVLQVRDELIARIAATFAARLEETARRGAHGKPAESLAAFELSLRGLALLRQGTVEADAQARVFFERALALDPACARAEAGLSLSWFNEWSCQHWAQFEENGRRAYEHAHRALDLDDRDPLVHLVLGRLLLYRREYEQASWYLDRALILCPNHAQTLIELALCEVYLGRPEIGIERAAKAMRLNPYHPNYYYAYAAMPQFAARNFERAVELNSRATGVPIVDIPANIAIALAHLGRIDEGRRHLAVFYDEFRKRITYGREPAPGQACRWLLDTNPYRRPEDRELVADGFRLLGDAGAASAPKRPNTPPPDAAALLRQGSGWLAIYAGRRALLPDMRGLHDIRRLLERPGEEVHCLDLAERSDESYGGDESLDDKARQALKTRIAQLREELDEAEAANDIVLAERLRQELEPLLEMLSKALGLGGRGRRIGSLTERARSTVTARIRHAIRRLQTAHEPLARHLENSVRTGTFCCYRPEQPITWRTAGEA